MSITLCLILLALLIGIGISTWRAWRDAKAMQRALDRRLAVPAGYDAWYISQTLRDTAIELYWRTRVAMNERQREKRKRQTMMEAA